MYEINVCSPIWDTVPNNWQNLRVTRILFAIDLFVLYVGFAVISFLLKKAINALKLEDKESNNERIALMEYRYQVHHCIIQVEMVD